MFTKVPSRLTEIKTKLYIDIFENAKGIEIGTKQRRRLQSGGSILGSWNEIRTVNLNKIKSITYLTAPNDYSYA